MFEFESASFHDIGGDTNIRDQQWASLEIRLKDTGNGHVSGVEIKLLVPRYPDATLHELEQAAERQAKAILTEALALLGQSSISDWRAKDWAQRDADAD